MSEVMVHPVMAELEQRAGASDHDKAAWLAQRRRGITATEIRDLMLKGPGFRADLIKEKVAAAQFVNAQTTDNTDEFKPGKAFVANQYTAWGKKREPVIAEWAESRFAIANESRVFHAIDDVRKLASPDGIGVCFDGELIVDEIKTGKDDLAPGGPAFTAKGYHLQILWVMRVIGARRCRYIWEQHDSDWQDRGGQFPEPAPLYSEPLSEWFEYDSKLVAEMDLIADAFLSDLDAALRDASAGDGPVIDDELDTLAVNYARFREMESEGKRAKEAAGAQIKALLKDKASFSQESALARISWTRGGTVTEVRKTDVPVVDEAAMRAEHPAAAKEYDLAAKALARATERARKADEMWGILLPLFSTVTVVEETTTKAVRENLTVTVPKIKEMDK